MPAVEVPTDEALSLLASAPVGRLVVSVADILDIFPVTHTVVDGDIAFRTAPGSKLAGLAVNASVLFEADSFGATESWSVVVRGLARRLERDDEISGFEGLLRPPFARGRKDVVVRIRPRTVTGRRFTPGDEDEPFVLDAPD
jgi:hypothetical protein